MEYVILAVVGMLILLMPVMLLIFFSLLAVIIFVWRKVFPLGWGIAEWVTNRRNLIPFVLFLLIVIAGSIILMIVSYIFATQVHAIGYLFLLLFLLIFYIAEIIFWGGLGLAMTLWIVRLSHWAYALFRGGFWRTFRPGGPPDFQPVPVPLTNPVLITLPSSKRTGNRRRQPLAKRRAISSTSLAAPPKEQAQVKKEAKRRRPVARRRETSPTVLPPPSNEMALAGVAAKQAKAQTKEDAKQAKAQAKEEAKQVKAQAEEEARKAKEQAREAKRNQAMAEAEEKAQAKEEAKQDIAEEKSGEITNPGRRRRLKRNK